ncbi:MATE efflux family protein [Prevotella sp. BV3P1]|uniref:MATE family efflux transporter n=1 Tax=Prevotellaceae TaxID=171552 RepID=UPI0003B8B6C4|nr:MULTISPECIES: MATE family efflux transporter [Prevotellaceae]ERT56368.1 MATE efflux family protein [Prevotella sp. BV3P1]KGF42437.1 GntR family transcriptional regulator [Hoylesella buccalis DNF00985]
MKQVFKLALPSIISNITVPLLGIIDLTIVGHMGDVIYIGAIAIGTMIFNVLYWLFGFLRMGTSGMTSQALGRRDLTEAMRLLVRSLTISTAIAVIFILFQLPIRWVALTIMQPTEQIAEQAAIYFSICIWGAPAMLGLYGLTGWFIGMQNTRIPMLVSIFQNIVNIVASVTFVFGFSMKIQGVALGTLTAQWTGFLLALYCWKRYYGRLAEYNWKDDLFKRSTMVRFFAVNRDIFIRTLFLVGVNFFFISAGSRQGAIILSVNTLLMTLFTLFSYVMDGFAYAGEALSGKYYSAANKLAFDRVYRSLFAWGAIMAVVFTLVYAVGGNGFLMLLTNEAVVVQAAEAYFWWAVMIPLVSVSAFVYDGIFIGLTATRGMLVSSVISALVFFALYLALQSYLGNHALWLAFIVYLGLRGGIQWLLYRRMHLNWVQK